MCVQPARDTVLTYQGHPTWIRLRTRWTGADVGVGHLWTGLQQVVAVRSRHRNRNGQRVAAVWKLARGTRTADGHLVALHHVLELLVDLVVLGLRSRSECVVRFGFGRVRRHHAVLVLLLQCENERANLKAQSNEWRDNCPRLSSLGPLLNALLC